MRAALGFDLAERRALRTWTDALRRFIEQVDSIGVLVMVNGVVGNNTRRKLDPEEFRGFALADDLAPLIFINGADTKAAQMFTLAHELAHIWLGESALSNVEPASAPSHAIEVWCNRIAAELLVPQETLRVAYREGEGLPAQLNRLARHFKVSTLVVLRRDLRHRRNRPRRVRSCLRARAGSHTVHGHGRRRQLPSNPQHAGWTEVRPRAGGQHVGRQDFVL